MPMNLTRDDLIVNHVYAAKRSAISGDYPGYFNDRQIIWIGSSSVQYDSPTVRRCRNYPTVTIEQFIKWAEKDITDIMPKDTWREYVSKTARQDAERD